ncbi:hypothetical protein FHS82_002882 [Pseudochelatococcus lubricantis]|uniref:DUF1468 domain-containing protein n=1 Tax=Pseudochelatococcus lubricantis TaxID=1538102 RepID=A0ABX0V1E2_9HYPH|nr:tripartite tricarboxylate transporter TctB family protein [Pseudochelatococcus lubricantis]NIJ59027.1 hypothetical protein [Pseudochelatococcus lubricantis]
MGIKSQKDFLSGLMFIALGMAYVIGASSYKIGSASNMGPGYFPLLLAILLTGIGVMVTYFSLAGEADPEGAITDFAPRPLIFVLAANLVFGVLLGGLPSLGLPSFGMLVAIAGLVFVVGMAIRPMRIKEMVLTAAILAVCCYVIFHLALRLPVPFWPAFL